MSHSEVVWRKETERDTKDGRITVCGSVIEYISKDILALSVSLFSIPMPE